jgi:integrase
MSNSYHASIWALFIIAFFSFARMSNLVPRSKWAFDVKIHLTRSDITVGRDGLVVVFRWSKTIQDGSRYLLIPLSEVPGSVLCPLKAFINMQKLCPASPLSSAFSYKYNNKVCTLTSPQVIKVLRKLLSKRGFSPRLFSGHSFRRSGATWAFSSGVRSEAIQHHGDWRSLSYLNYITISHQQKIQVSQLMADRIKDGSLWL